jgi:raffinose/stachyose/melibiose transport system permease protein
MKFSFQQDKKIAVVIFLTLPVLLFLIFYIYPLIYTVFLSFHEWDGLSISMTPVGFDNYKDIFKSSEFLISIQNNAKWLVFYVIIPPGIGLILALFTNRIRKGTGILEAIYYLPSAITPIAVGAIWKWIYDPGYGLFNTLLSKIGFGEYTQNWLGDPGNAIYSMMLAATWIGIGVPFILYLAGLKTVPKDLIEAARIDGAGFFRRFYSVIWPMLAPSTVIVIAFSALGAIRLFDLIYALAGVRPSYFNNVLAVYMYKISFNVFKLGQGAAIAVILFLIAALILSPYLIYSNKKTEEIRQ